jgi:hypothetical protein
MCFNAIHTSGKTQANPSFIHAAYSQTIATALWSWVKEVADSTSQTNHGMSVKSERLRERRARENVRGDGVAPGWMTVGGPRHPICMHIRRQQRSQAVWACWDWGEGRAPSRPSKGKPASMERKLIRVRQPVRPYTTVNSVRHMYQWARNALGI